MLGMRVFGQDGSWRRHGPVELQDPFVMGVGQVNCGVVEGRSRWAHLQSVFLSTKVPRMSREPCRESY